MLHLLRRLSLRNRISLMTLAIVLVSLWGLTFFASVTLRKNMPDFMGQQQESAARVLADNLEREVQRHTATLSSLATQLRPATLHSPAAAQAFLASHGEAADLFNGGIVLYNRSGIAVADTLPGAGRLGQPASDPQMLAHVLEQGTVAFSKPQMDPVMQSPQIGMATAVRDAAGIVVGALVGVVQLSLPNFLDPVRLGHYGKEGHFVVIDTTHRMVVATSDPTLTLAALPAPGSIAALDRFVAGAQGPATFVNERGVEVQAAVRQVPTARWLVLIALPTATALAPVTDMQTQLWVAATAIALLTWLLTHVLLGRYMAPALTAIDQITQRMTQVDDDGVAQPLTVRRTDEIGRLITAFNRQLDAEAQRKAMLREVLNTSNVGIFAADGNGCITLANDTMGRLFGRPAQSLVGMRYLDIVAESDRPAAQSSKATLRSTQGLSLEARRRFVRGDGSEFWGQVAVRQFLPSSDHVRGIVGVVTDISQAVEIHDYELFRRHTLELLARNTALPDILDAIVRGVEALRPASMCSILILQSDGKRLAQGVAPSLPADYNAAIEGLEIGPFVGSCGAAAYSGERVVAQDLQTHANWAAYRTLTARAGVQACWSQPLRGRDGAVLGTIALYHRTPQAPLDKDVELIEQAAHLASLAITQHRDAQAALEGEERFRRVMETSPSVAVRGYRADGTVVFWNQAAEQLYGYSAAQALGHNLIDLIFPAERRAQVRAAVADFFASGQTPPAGELQLVTKDGQAVTVFSSHALLQRDNHPAECFCMDVDLSERARSALALRESEARYRAMIEWSPHPMAVHRDGMVVYVNPASVAMMGAPDAPALLGKPLLDFVHPDSRALVLERARQVALTGQSVPTVPEKYLRLDGTTIEVEAIATHIVFDGEPSVLVSMHDVTGRNQAQRRLQLSAQVFDHAREGIMVTDAKGDIVEVNAAFTRITGYERAEVLGRNPRLLNSGRQGKDYYAAMWQTLVGTGNWSGEAWNRRKSGEIFAVLQTIGTVHDAAGIPINYVSLFSDVTAAKEHAQYIERIAHYDALTNLPNRVLLADRLQQAMKQAQRRNLQTAVAFLDLDGFKSVNDLHGHDVGDELLLVLAQRMRMALRESDTLARMGGDEFVAVIVDLADPQACVPLLARLLEAAAEPVILGDDTLQVTASVGVAFYPQPEDVDADQLLRQADQAMYQAKLAGKNRYHVFDAEQDRHVRGHHESLDRIRTALAQREFVLYYQPKVNMRTGQVMGAEALIRWQHPGQGLLAPANFLPMVEDNPLGVEIGQWVLANAIAQLAQWNAEGLDIHVSVNIGARQLQHPQFLEHLRSLLAEHPQLDPRHLELEVLETSALEDLAHVSRLIQDCADMGVGFALDDFGTGYSSLSYLKRLPASVLKIDQSFVRDMLDDPDDLAILDGVIGLASAFRREVIAEGVETEHHGTLLLQLGCELGQGYGIARPMQADLFARWALDWQPHALWRQTHRVHREDFALLYVVVEHRAWCNAVGAFVRGQSGALGHQMLHECRFGRWLNREGSVRYGHDPLFVLMDTLHERMHRHAAQLHRWACDGRQAEAQAGLAELMTMQEKLAAHIQRLLVHPA